MTAETTRADLYQRVTDRIVAMIEAGAGEFRMPWHTSGRDVAAPINARTRKRYRGINVVALWATAQSCGYASGAWATYRQWEELGAQVRKGERSTLVVLWKPVEGKAVAEESGSDDEERPSKRHLIARGHHVFNAAQVDGYSPPAAPVLPEAERIADAEAFFDALNIQIRHGGDMAYFHKHGSYVQMPPFSSFRDASAYYSVLAHECVHATAPRLNRDLTGRFGSESYSFEEIVAELGAAMACADLGISVEPRPDHAAYVASWLKVLRQDKRAIFTAASKAQAAVDWMHAQQQPYRTEA
jgi:antirestriction protein ArdC